MRTISPVTNATSLLKARPFRVAALAASTAALAFGLSIASAQTAAPGTAPISARAATQIAPPVGPRYNDKWEIYGGLSFMNGQAGQDLPKRYNMGGGEVMGTYWLGPKLGVAADYRLEAGTTPVLSPYYNRVLVYQNIISGGVQYRGPKNRYAAVDYHAFAGITDGVFDNAVKNYPGGSPVAACDAQISGSQTRSLGLYCNHSSFFGAFGGSVDFNYSPRLAIRLQPDLIMEHFGTELREFVSVSGGVVYRFGRR